MGTVVGRSGVMAGRGAVGVGDSGEWKKAGAMSVVVERV